MTAILLGTAEGNHLKLEVDGWLDDAPENEIDAGWLRATVDLVVYPFRGSYPLDVRIEDLQDFRNDLAQLHTAFRSGEARFAPSLGTPLKFKVCVGATGRIECLGRAVGNKDEEFEQTLDFKILVPVALLELLRMVEAQLAAYPARSPRFT